MTNPLDALDRLWLIARFGELDKEVALELYDLVRKELARK